MFFWWLPRNIRLNLYNGQLQFKIKEEIFVSPKLFFYKKHIFPTTFYRNITQKNYSITEGIVHFILSIRHCIYSVTFFEHGRHDHRRKYSILSNHWYWLSSVYKQTDFDWSIAQNKSFRFFEIGILLIDPNLCSRTNDFSLFLENYHCTLCEIWGLMW